VRGSARNCHPVELTLTFPLSLPKGEATQPVERQASFRIWTRNFEGLIFAIEYAP